MARKKFTQPSPYKMLESSCLNATSVEVLETGTVRIGQLLEWIAEALQQHPEASLSLTRAIAIRLGTNPEIRILP